MVLVDLGKFASDELTLICWYKSQSSNNSSKYNIASKVSNTEAGVNGQLKKVIM